MEERPVTCSRGQCLASQEKIALHNNSRRRPAARIPSIMQALRRQYLTSRLLRIIVCACALPAWLVATTALAQNAQAQNHVRTYREWEAFPVGAWKQVRVYRESFDEQGKLTQTSIADTKTTLVSTDEKGFSLKTEMTYEVAGKRFNPQPEVHWYGFHGEPKGQEVASEKVGQEMVEVDGLKLPADVYRLTFHEGTRRREVRAHLSEMFPYLLRKRSVLLEPNGETPKELDSLTMEVVALDLPFKVLAELKTTSHVRTTYQGPDARSVTLEVHCHEVPGSVVAHWSKKYDVRGRLLERSTLELIDYGMGETQSTSILPRRPLFGRSRSQPRLPQ
jgi:hypothetical protein